MSTPINNEYLFTSSANNSLGEMIPMSVSQQGLLSGTSEAIACFVGQGFSSKLQVYMINYVASVSSSYPLYV